MLTVKEINEISFGKAGFSGYKPEDVDNFIDEVVESFQQLQAENPQANPQTSCRPVSRKKLIFRPVTRRSPRRDRNRMIA